MQPPMAILAARARAQYRFTLQLDSLEPEDTGSPGLHTCRATGRVVAVHRGPLAILRWWRGHPEAPRLHRPFSVLVKCWPHGRPSMPGPSRVAYGAPGPGRIRVWGFFMGGEFVVSDVADEEA
jgi:hypothetical protein